MDADACYRAGCARDARFDGLFFTAVRSTRIFCRPICPARIPLRRNVEYFPNAAAALAAGYSFPVAENTWQKIWKPRVRAEFELLNEFLCVKLLNRSHCGPRTR